MREDVASPSGSSLPRAVIDLGAVAANGRLARRLAPASRLLAVIKADAYGHGVEAVAGALRGIADGFAVARLGEGLELRRAGFEEPIVLLQGCLGPGELREASARSLEVVVHRRDQLAELLEAAAEEPVRGSRVWLKLDSGMHRLGMAPEELRSAHSRLRAAGMEIVLMSHLATADEADPTFSRRQTELFVETTRGLAGTRSLANSAALLTAPAAHFDWVRPGIMLYGASPLERPTPEAGELQPAMTLESEVIALRELELGEAVGYGRRFVCARRSRIATVAAGYGDGYPRHAPDGTPVRIAGRRAPLAGRVSMDSLAVDVTELPEVEVGSPVELWGKTLPVTEVAAACHTISYELLTRVAPRVPRISR